LPADHYQHSQQYLLTTAQVNVPSAVNATDTTVDGRQVHYLRSITFFGPDGFVGYSKPIASNRRNPYLPDHGLDAVRPGSTIKTYDCSNVNNPQPVPPPDNPPPCQVESSPFPPGFGGGRFPHLTRDAP